MQSPLGQAVVPELTVHELVLQNCWEHGNKVAMVDATNGKSYTYTQLHRNIRQVASGLARLGIKKGDIVAMFSPNNPEYVFMLYAILATGATITPINPAYTVYELTRHLNEFTVSWVYTVDALAGMVDKATRNANSLKGVICLGDAPHTVSFSRLLGDDSSYPNDITFNVREDVAVILTSSGTTGLPKGVMLTHYNLMAMFTAQNHPDVRPRSLPGGGQRTVLTIVPFYHGYGVLRIMIHRLIIGDLLVILRGFQPEQCLAAIEKYRIMDLPLVPPVVVFLAKSPLTLKYDLSSVVSVHCGAAPLSKEIYEEFAMKFHKPRITEGYSMTELTATACGCLYPHTPKPGSCGQPLVNTEIQVVDPDMKTCLGPNKKGELWVRGPQTMKGYWNNPRATRETIDSDGWLHTGDIGYYDVDGYFYIVDRMKELIKYKGFQVAPAELEALVTNHPCVADVGVIGIPDERAGELPKAFVVKTPGVTLTEQDLHKYVNERVANYKQLRGGIEFISSIPKSPSGKILRKDLRQLVKTGKL